MLVGPTSTLPNPGLTTAEVAERVANGQTNDVPDRASRSIADIVRANVFTRINAILGVLLVLILATGSPIDGMFGLLIIANSAVGMIQEIRAKQTLDKLAIVGQARPTVRRNGAAIEIARHDVVLDEIVELGPGDQIVVDGEVIEFASLEVDESLLTGEADPVAKGEGDQILSGSFVVSGSGAYRATKVGRDAYAAKIAEEASRFTLVHSELRNGINKILKFITYLLVPAGLLIIYNQLFSSGESLRPAIAGMVAALVPMVPEGLVLMTSIAFAVGVVRLGKRQCLVQELPAIEGLARVDVVCADKTGTLTENGMRVAEVRELAGTATAPVLAALAAADPRPNASILAIIEAYPDDPRWTSTAIMPFSSARKWSGVSFGDHGNWLIGAPDILLDTAHDAALEAEALGEQGLRVLLLASTTVPVDHPEAQALAEPAALVVLEQRVRPDAKPTLEYFASQNVKIKVISGDNAKSVGAVASSLGLPSQAIDARTLPDDRDELATVLETATTFGRVRPDQKRDMVGALQSKGHTVAMTGDGVNDVLALKDADIGVAMGAGSPATRAVAQIVLLDNKFATLPYVVAEGRRVIGNIERVSNLFLTKTVYSVLLALCIGIGGALLPLFGHDPLPYPFLPRHVTLAGWFTIGIPAFLLSLAPNNERAKPNFVSRVMRQALPFGFVIGVCTFVAYLLAYDGPDSRVPAGSAALIALIMIALWVLGLVARPYEWWKVALIAFSAVFYTAIFALPMTREFFLLDLAYAPVGLATGLVGIVLVEAVWWWNKRRD